MLEIFVFLALLYILNHILSKYKVSVSFITLVIASFLVSSSISYFISLQKLGISDGITAYLKSLVYQNPLLSIPFLLLFSVASYGFFSVVIIKEGDSALVERLGRYRAKLDPGLNLIVPLVDSVVLTASMKEMVIDLEPQSATTRDDIPVKIELSVFWRIYNLERTYYAVEDVESAVADTARASLIAYVGRANFSEIFSSQDEMNRLLLDELDEVTDPWGVKVNYTRIQNIAFSPIIQAKMNEQGAAEIDKQIEIAKSQARSEGIIIESQARIEELRRESDAIEAIASFGNKQRIMAYLLIKRQIEASNRLAESENAKVIYTDSKTPIHILDDFAEMFQEGDD